MIINLKLVDLVNKHKGSMSINNMRLQCYYPIYEKGGDFVSVGIDSDTGCFDEDGDEQIVFTIITQSSGYNMRFLPSSSHLEGMEMLKDNLTELPDLWREREVRQKIGDMFAIGKLLMAQ